MENNELLHYGILGMKWGVRRYQNKDGTLTPEGKMRYRASNRPIAKWLREYVNDDGELTEKGTKNSWKNVLDRRCQNAYGKTPH